MKLRAGERREREREERERREKEKEDLKFKLSLSLSLSFPFCCESFSPDALCIHRKTTSGDKLCQKPDEFTIVKLNIFTYV